MSSFEFNTRDWFEGTAPEELAVTNNSLSVAVNGKVVTYLLNKAIKSTSNEVYLPLYPVAEWIAANWWRLLYECNPHRDVESFQTCHNLKYAGEGYFLPDLLLAPEIDVVHLTWNERAINHGELSFLGYGSENIPFEDVKNELARFVRFVIGRLLANNISDTPLQKDWAAIEASTRDAEERDFCIACAQLGFDPYCISASCADEIIEADERLSGKISLGEFFNTVALGHIKASVEWLEQIGTADSKNSAFNNELRRIKELLPDFSHALPWERGYKEARWVRANFFKTQSAFRDFQQKMMAETFQKTVPFSLCSALVETSEKQTPMFISTSQKNNFLAGRMLGEYLHSSADHINLVTKVSTPSQKRCRAFSAELNAPAEWLKQDLNGKRLVCDDDIAELAEKYQVNELVVKYQLVNHNLAAVL